MNVHECMQTSMIFHCVWMLYFEEFGCIKCFECSWNYMFFILDGTWLYGWYSISCDIACYEIAQVRSVESMYWLLVKHIEQYEKENKISPNIMWKEKMCVYLVIDIVSTSQWCIYMFENRVNVSLF